MGESALVLLLAHRFLWRRPLVQDVSARRDVISYVGTAAIGGIVGYYARAKGLLGLRSSDPTGDPEESTPTPSQQQPTTTPPSEDSADGLLSPPFTERFQDGLNGWAISHRYRTDPAEAPSNPSAGEGEHSSKYGGSVRLRVSGGPSTIGVGRQTTGLTAGTTLSATVQVEEANNEPGNVTVAVFAPDGDDSPDERTQNNGDVSNGEIELTHTVEETYPSGTEVRVWADVWPGEFTAYVVAVRAQQ